MLVNREQEHVRGSSMEDPGVFLAVSKIAVVKTTNGINKIQYGSNPSLRQINHASTPSTAAQHGIHVLVFTFSLPEIGKSA